MPPPRKEDLTVLQIKQYRAFVFPESLATRDDATPFLGASEKDSWITKEALALFWTPLSSMEKAADSDRSQWESQPASVLSDYLKFIFPYKSKFLSLPFFDLENADQWVLDVPFNLWMQSHQSSVKKEDSPEPSFVKLGKRKAKTYSSSSPATSVIEISSDEDRGNAVEPRSVKAATKIKSARPAKKVKVEDVPIEVLSDEVDEKLPTQTATTTPASEKASTSNLTRQKHMPAKQARQASMHEPIDRKTARQVTREFWVQHIKEIKEIPSQWDISRELTGYIVDLTDNTKYDLEKKSITKWVRRECQSSLDGNSGRDKGDVWVYAGILADAKEGKVRCRRGEWVCNGTKICEFLDRSRLEGFEGWEVDPDEMKPFWSGELDANEEEASNTDAALLRFYTSAVSTKCKIKCNGKAVLREVPANRPSYNNRKYFIGCDQYRKNDHGAHRSIQIPNNLNESEVVALFKNDGRITHKKDVQLHGSCSVVVHPRSHKVDCPFTHVIGDEVRVGNIGFHHGPCPSRLLIFEEVETGDTPKAPRKALVVPQYPHNHPRHSHAKPTLDDEQLLEKLAAASRKARIAPKELRTSATTLEILGGRTWEEALPSMTDNQRLRRWIDKLSTGRYPEGLGWKGLQHEFDIVESVKPKNERYIHSVISKSNGTKLIVTMHPDLIKYIHSVTFLVIDYTFKRIRGDLNEWAVVSMLERFQTRVQFASLYCNKATRPAFKMLVDEFFDTVRDITGKKLEFFIFNRESKLLCLIFDAEAPQMQGCGDAVLPMNNPEVSGITTQDPLVIIQHIAKTCVEHFWRNIDELPKNIPRDVIDRLKSFPHLSSHDAVNEWRKFCVESEYVKVRDWYANKECHPWYLPSLNPFLSPMKKECWENTPSDSNVGESAHAFRHSETTVGAPILLAIQESRINDESLIKRLATFDGKFVSANRWNSLKSRAKKSAARRGAKAKKAQAVRIAREGYKELEEKLTNLARQKKESLDKSRDIKRRLLDIAGRPATAELEQEKKRLKKVEAELLAERRVWNTSTSELQKQQGLLKDGALKNSRVHDPRPLSEVRSSSPDLPAEDEQSFFEAGIPHANAAAHDNSNSNLPAEDDNFQDSMSTSSLLHEAFTDTDNSSSSSDSEDNDPSIEEDPLGYFAEADSSNSGTFGLPLPPESNHEDIDNIPWQMDPDCGAILDHFLSLFPDDI